MDDMLYTVKEVAEILHCNANKVHELRKAGLLKFMKLGSYKVRKVSLEEFLATYDGMDISDPFHVSVLSSDDDTDTETA